MQAKDTEDLIMSLEEDTLRGVVAEVVVHTSGAGLILVKGRAVHKFRKQLAEMGDKGRAQMCERFPGVEGKKYENDSWRGLWDRVLDTFPLDSKTQHRARAMCKYGDFLIMAEAIEAHCHEALPSALITHSQAVQHIQRRLKDDDMEKTEKAKILEAVAVAFAAAFKKLGGKRRIAGTRPDAEAVDAALLQECDARGIHVEGGVKQPRKRKRSEDADPVEVPAEGDGSDEPAGKKAATLPGDAAEGFAALAELLGEEKACTYLQWFAREVKQLSAEAGPAALDPWDLFVPKCNVEELEEYEEKADMGAPPASA